MKNLKSSRLAIFICLVFTICAAIVFSYIKAELEPPTITLAAPRQVNRQTPLNIEVHGQGRMILGANLDIRVVCGASEYFLVPRNSAFDAKTGTLAMQIFLSDYPEQLDGEIIIKVSVANQRGGGIWDNFLSARAQRAFTVTADLAGPEAAVIFNPQTPVLGGAALLVITPSEKLNSIKLSSGLNEYRAAPFGSKTYVAFAAFPHDWRNEDRRITLQMEDLAGNISTFELSPPIADFAFRADNIRLDDNFFNTKYAEFKKNIGKNASPLELFLLMNSTVRQESYATLRLLCAASRPEKLWHGTFLEMPGATRRSEFADRRNYIYNGKVIDKQVHMGLDYASVVKDKIPAANSGIVAFAGYLGIHGKAVLIDHGLGLFSLYSHLSEIIAKDGQQVAKGQIIGRTGTTGMAYGDHLHFEILVNGVSVNPDFFFNDEWVKQNINAPLDESTKTAQERNSPVPARRAYPGE